jgi:signal transduction histidine kinase
MAQPQFSSPELMMRSNVENHPKSAQTVSLDAEKLLAAFLGLYRESSLGSLIKGVVHNLNGSLQILSIQMEILQRMLQKDDRIGPDIRKKAEQCVGQIEQFRSAIQVLMQRSAASEEEGPERISLNDILEEELAILHHNLFFKHHVQVEKALSPSLPLLHGRRESFTSGLANVIQNAIEAMEATPRKVLTIGTISSTQGAEVTIQDTGCGVADELRPRLFEPFFTTKGGRHSGLGLYLAKKLLAPYNVKFRYAFQKDQTVLRVLFPFLLSGKRKKFPSDPLIENPV